MAQQDEQIFMALAKTAEWRLAEFNAQDLDNSAWAFALSLHERFTQVWSLLEHVEANGISSSPLCWTALLMECEQRGLCTNRIALLNGLGVAANTEISFGAAVDRVAAMHLAQTNEMKLPDFR